MFCLAALSALTLQAGVDYSTYERLLERYVRDEGVRYEAWAGNEEDLAALDRFLKQAAVVDVPALGEAGQKAFYINLYNAAMLQAVFEHWPLDSVEEIGLLPFSIFKKKFIRQGGRRLSLDEVEKEILLKEYSDPRIHFAVNCASESCPPLRTEPYVGARLDAQLDEQARRFARSEHAARIDTAEERVAFSELFKWYADDFPGDHPAEYLNAWRDEKIPLDYATDWIPYDWSINAAE
ncbi:MAG: DUF547 domain-containing protein [Verrucomicrobiota bacterium]